MPVRMSKEMAKAKNIDISPDSPVYVGDRAAQEMDLSIITYDKTSAQIKNLSSVDELSQFQSKSKITWINISGLKDIDSIKKLGLMYNIHPLSIEDILNTEQQPKVEIFKDYRFLSIKTIQREKNFHHVQNRKNKPVKISGNKGKYRPSNEM
jgi:magnesium transporter